MNNKRTDTAATKGEHGSPGQANNNIWYTHAGSSDDIGRVSADPAPRGFPFVSGPLSTRAFLHFALQRTPSPSLVPAFCVGGFLREFARTQRTSTAAYRPRRVRRGSAGCQCCSASRLIAVVRVARRIAHPPSAPASASAASTSLRVDHTQYCCTPSAPIRSPRVGTVLSNFVGGCA